MNVWIVTTGSSDVQLTSDEAWDDWWYDIKNSIYRLDFKPTRAIDDDEEPYRLPARVISIAHEKLSKQVQSYLTFPLLQNFTQVLRDKEIQLDHIIVLVSNQENIFPESMRETKRCAYWQDTCQLYPILETYLREQFPNVVIKPLILKLESSERAVDAKEIVKGLDDWDSVLGLVKKNFKKLKFEPEPQTVYVSHQAGTPAISSAVQFVSLSTFGDRVKFLVSNEQDKTLTGIVESSAYLRGIKREQAKKLLDRHDYSGIKTVIDTYLDNETQILLEAAIQWNFAKFDEFAAKIKSSSSNQTLVQQVEERSQHWWWTAYESAFLGVVRLKQGNTVEAMFHSFRAVEGLLRQWIDEHDKSLHNAGKPKLQKNGNGKIQLPRPVKFKTQKGEEKEITTANPYGQGLYFVLDSIRGIKREQDIDIWTFGNSVFYCRNNLFHQLEGLQDKEAVFREWDTTDEQSWKNRVINCLNFVSGKQYQFSDNDNSNEHAISLMVRVHQELEKAIAQL